MRRLGPLCVLLWLAGCADTSPGFVLGGFVLGLPSDEAAPRVDAEVTVFLGSGASAAEVAAFPVEDAVVEVRTLDRVIEPPHVADGFYLTRTEMSPGLQYEAGAQWELGAQIGEARPTATGTGPEPPMIFGAPLDGTWPLATAMDLSVPMADADRGFFWVEGPQGVITATDEPQTTGLLLRWLDEAPGYSDVQVPAEAFEVPGDYGVVVVTAQDVDASGLQATHPRSTVALGSASRIRFTVQ